MSSSLFVTLALAAASVGALHTLAPDHWLPIAAVSRARNWSLGRTARVALLCGTGHVTVTAALGLLALVTGMHVMSVLGAQIAAVAWLLMIGFGVAYIVWGLRHLVIDRLHGHHHAHLDHVHDPTRISVGALLAIYCADACIALFPIIFAAAPLSLPAVLAIILVYEVATIATMVTLVVVSRAGVGRVSGTWVQRYGDTAAGGLIVATGIAVALIGI